LDQPKTSISKNNMKNFYVIQQIFVLIDVDGQKTIFRNLDNLYLDKRLCYA